MVRGSAAAILAQHNVKVNKNAVPKQVAQAAEKFRKEIKASVESKKDKTGETAESRAELMAQVQSRGVKNFRILNKQELLKVIEMKRSGANDEQIRTQVVDPAVTRWKAGWGTRSKTEVASPGAS